MNSRLLLSAFALMTLLSCQNESAAPSAPQGETGTLALRVVSAKALAQVDSVSVSLSWGTDISIHRKAAWSAPSIKLDGLPLGVRIAVRMEGWNAVRGRTLVIWRGDTAVQLGGDTNWEIDKEGTPILIESTESALTAAPNLARILPEGYAIANGSLKRILIGSGSDTIRLDINEGDSIYVDGNALQGASIVIGSGEEKDVLVVGKNGMSSTFRVYAYTQLPTKGNLVKTSAPGASWSTDTLSISLSAGSSATLTIGTDGVDSLFKAGKLENRSGAGYVIAVSKTDTFDVVAKGAAGQSTKVTVVVQVAEKPDAKPGLGASLGLLPHRAGAICSLRVSRDSGQVDSVVLVSPARKAFAHPSESSSWMLDWTTSGDTATLEIHVYGVGSAGRDSIVLRTGVLKFDRQGPALWIDGARVVGVSGGTLRSKATDDGGVASSWITDAGGASISCPLDDYCQVSGVEKTFVVHAKDKLGNQTDSTVTIVMDASAPRIDSVLDQNTDKPLKSDDTLWVKANATGGSIRVFASDSLSEFQITASANGASDKSAQGGVLSGMTAGTWTLGASDNLGNAMVWGKIVVMERVEEIQKTPGLGVHFDALPAWVADSCFVKIVHDSGIIDTVVALGVTFRPSQDKKIWSAWWSPAKSAGPDTLRITARGQGSKGPDSIQREAVVAVDRKGPDIELKSRTRFGALRVGKDGGELAVSVQDNRGVDSVWLTNGVAIAKAKGDSLYRANVTGSVTVKARDSLGNIGFCEIAAVRDTDAPSVVEVRDGVGNTLAHGAYVRRDTTTGVARLEVKATDSSGFVVRMKDAERIRTAIGMNGKAVFDSLSMGVYEVVVEDGLGNQKTWGNVVVRIRPPVLNWPSGTYGEGETKCYGGPGEEFDALEFNARCLDGGYVLTRTHGDAAASWARVTWNYLYNRSSDDYRCVKGTDSSEIETRTYDVLQSPTIVGSESTYSGDSLLVAINLDPGGFAHNPSDAKIQYWLGDDSSDVVWDVYRLPLVVKGTQALWASVSYGGKYSRTVKRIFTKVDTTVAWERDFGAAKAVVAKDLAALKDNYQIIAWTNHSFDTLSGSRSGTSPLRLAMKWNTVDRGGNGNEYGAFGADMFLDVDYSTYDFTNVDSIVFDYMATGSMQDLRVYPVDDQGLAEQGGIALHYADSGNGVPPSSSRHVSIDLSGNTVTSLKYPSWGSKPENPKTWKDIEGGIKALRFMVEAMSDDQAVPTERTTTISISRVTVYGKITKKDQ